MHGDVVSTYIKVSLSMCSLFLALFQLIMELPSQHVCLPYLMPV